MDAELQTDSAAVPVRENSGESETGAAKFYVHKDDLTYGPESMGNLHRLFEAGWLQSGDLVWQEGAPEWMTAATVFTSFFQTSIQPQEGEMVLPCDEADDAFFQPTAVRISAGNPWPWGSLGIAVAAHAALLVFAVELFQLFPIKFDPYNAPAVVEPPPLEVAMVTEAEPPPPPPPSQPPPDAPPPDMPPPPPIPTLATAELPPPPPAPAEMPVPSIEPPPLPVESMIPREMTPTQVAPKAESRPHQLAKAPVVTVRRIAPPEAPPAEAGAPEYLADPRPEYPYAAKLRHQEGTVLLLVTLDDAGNPTSVAIEHSSGSSLLDDAARKKVASDWRFKPGQGSVVHVPVEFHLDE